MTREGKPLGFAAIAILAPLPALVIGVLVMRNSGVPAARWAVNLGAWLTGALLVLGCSLIRPERFFAGARAASFIAPVLLALTFWFDGIDGVHRWILLGPVRLHVGSLAGPLIVFAVAMPPAKERYGSALLLSLACLALCSAQPDAGQASAVAAALATVLIVGSRSTWRYAAAAVAIGACALAWLRPDPLSPVPEVEGVLGLAWKESAAIGVASIFALALLVSPFLAAYMQKRKAKPASAHLALAFAAYFAAAIGVTQAGAFPVPVLGFGASPILGYSIALALTLVDGEPSVTPQQLPRAARAPEHH